MASCTEKLVRVESDPDVISAPQHNDNLFSEDCMPNDIINYIFSFFDTAEYFQSDYLGILACVCKRFYVTSYNFNKGWVSAHFADYKHGIGTYFPSLSFIRRHMASPRCSCFELYTRCSYLLDEENFCSLFDGGYIDAGKTLKKYSYILDKYENTGIDGIPAFLDAVFFNETLSVDKKIKSFDNICAVKRLRKKIAVSPKLSTFFMDAIKRYPGGNNFTRIIVKRADVIPRDLALDYLKCAIDAWSEEDVIALFNTKQFDFARDKIGDVTILDYIISLFAGDKKPLDKLMNHLCPLMSETQLDAYFKNSGMPGTRRLLKVGSIVPTFGMFLKEARKSKSAALLWDHIPTTEKMRICPTWKPPPEKPTSKRGRKKKE